MYVEKINGRRVRSKCTWYKDGEKRVKLFLNLEKYRRVKVSLRTTMINGKKINEPKEISNALYEFHQTLSKVKLS